MKFLIPIVVGAIIGYFTNWIAIKMLFRPHHEKRIMGLKIPFTPGLIPKERERIGKSIGETVGVYLLSPETIIQSLSNKKTDDQVRLWLENIIVKLKENNNTIENLLDTLPSETYDDLVKTIEINISNMVISKVRESEFRSIIYNSLQSKMESIDSNNIYKIIEDRLGIFLGDLSNSSELKDGLINLMESKLNEILSEDKTIAEIVPEEIINSINKYIDENGNGIADSIRKGFKDPIIQNKLKASISELVLQNMSRMITAFISPDLISEKIFHIVEKYIDSEETNKDIIMMIRSLLDKLLESKSSTMVSKIEGSGGNEVISKIADILIGYIADKENHNSLLELIGKKLRDSEPENREIIVDYLTRNIDTILDSKDMENTIVIFVQGIIKKCMNNPISWIFASIDDDFILKGYGFLKVLFDRFAKDELPNIIEMFDISKIVEDKINSFDTDFTEKLILDIAEKELKAITWLGGLLGGIIGILSPLLQMLY